MRKALVILCVALQGCASFVNPYVVGGCQTADMVTTAYAIHHGAVEANPLWSGMPGAIPILFKTIFVIGVTWYIYDRWQYYKARKEEPSATDRVLWTGLAALGCGAAVQNIMLIHGLP